MMKSAQDGVRTYDAGSLDQTRDRRILVQRPMRSNAVVIGRIVFQNSAQMCLVQNDDEPRATARPFGQRGLTPPPASNQGPACDRRLDVAQQPIANAGSKGLPVFRTPKHRTNNLRIAATTICLGLSRPRAFNRVTSATIAGLYRIADIAGM